MRLELKLFKWMKWKKSTKTGGKKDSIPIGDLLERVNKGEVGVQV